MKKTTEIIGFVFKALIAGLAIAFIVIYLWPTLAGGGKASDTGQNGTVVQTPPESVAPVSYADAVNRAAPAVVSIYTSSLAPQPVTPETQQRLGDRYLYRMRRDMGSGVLVSEDGYILTNHHVISEAQNIKVALWDGRLSNAQVVGSDPETDLAVLKIKLKGLPMAPIAEGEPPRVGDVVLAIGNALGLSHTVTMGIISATRRDNIGSPMFEGFLQTDAAINAGNSGGALVNAKGELIGINTRNLGGIQGAQNIGFAIPMVIAQGVMRQIIEYGSVQRGWIGAEFTDFPPAVMSEGEQDHRGIYVRSVAQGGPAWVAGIREGDAILSLNGTVYLDRQAFNLSISSFKPGTRVEMEVGRGKAQFQTYATVIQQPPMP
ncbi:MAG TPA: trypsin-like peptidase domain-containing protein [Xanthomonadales bacterium]|nr:trypsin-like peptidase domain-containing protein [Xanthomonadales bacterium]